MEDRMTLTFSAYERAALALHAKIERENGGNTKWGELPHEGRVAYMEDVVTVAAQLVRDMPLGQQSEVMKYLASTEGDDSILVSSGSARLDP